ncbi:hypothetical protein IAQ61_006900 [Plenodomus lingam]|uniref:uncharacterized protein n=1 Tax=Leptosphaeria maculans TaxID=5022 RepID=UPI0033315D57|nr:hypothetical protein IAQ61_006900 [Plenodomus lingam]
MQNGSQWESARAADNVIIVYPKSATDLRVWNMELLESVMKVAADLGRSRSQARLVHNVLRPASTFGERQGVLVSTGNRRLRRRISDSAST